MSEALAGIEHLRLHGYWRSSCTWRVRIGLALKGLKYEYVPVHLVREGGEQHRPEFANLNAMAQVPVLEWRAGGSDYSLTQSLAILRFVDAIAPEPSLEPSSPLLCARAWEAAEVINAGIQPLQNLATMKLITALGGDGKKTAREAIEKGFVAVERILAKSNGRFAVGDRPTIADCCLIPQVYNARRQDVDLEPFPTIRRVEAACSELPAFRSAHPDVQSDADLGK